jgi:hypothetical protein
VIVPKQSELHLIRDFPAAGQCIAQRDERAPKCALFFCGTLHCHLCMVLAQLVPKLQSEKVTNFFPSNHLFVSAFRPATDVRLPCNTN